jgi:spore coat polysaccharide biosynthesis protein SpsF
VTGVVALVQARCTSERLPGKVMLALAGRPVVEHVLRAARATAEIDEVVLATTTRSEDDAMAAFARDELGVRVHRGSEDDVLGRFAGALEGHAGDVVVRLTADNPLQDPAVTGAVVRRFLAGDCDYASNNGERSWPRGLDCEVLSRELLERCARDAHRPEDREHVTFHVRTHPERYRLANVLAPPEEFWPQLRLSLDTAQDLALLRRVFDALHEPGAPPLAIGTVIAWLREHPEVVALNAGVEQKPTLGRIL